MRSSMPRPVDSPARMSAIWVLVGTRPEVIKQAPVYIACRDAFGPDAVALIGTGQHRELLDLAPADFDLALDADLDWAYERSAARSPGTFDEIFGDGHAGPRIAALLEERLAPR